MCAGVSSHVDDEYKWAGVEDPKVMVTTSRDPSSRLKMFAKVSTYLMACAVISTLVLDDFHRCFCILQMKNENTQNNFQI